MKHNKFLFGLAAILLLTAACNKQEPVLSVEQTVESVILTRAIGDKTPIVSVYVETNDVNPLNVLDYKIGRKYFIDVCELFAANIHKQTVNGNIEPTVYLNDKLTPILEGGLSTYVTPIKSVGTKVLLTMLGDWQGIGLANMNDTQQKQFANILAWIVEKYKLDGIGFDDEYADYPFFPRPSAASYAGIINYFKELCPDAMVNVFDYGGRTGSIDPTKVNYAFHGSFGQYMSTSNIPELPVAKWSPMCFNLGLDNSLTTVEDYAADTKVSSYGAMMFFNIRTRTEKDALPVFQAAARGAYPGQNVSCVANGGNRPRTATPVPAGYTITNTAAKAGLQAAGKSFFNI